MGIVGVVVFIPTLIRVHGRAPLYTIPDVWQRMHTRLGSPPSYTGHPGSDARCMMPRYRSGDDARGAIVYTVFYS